MKREDLSATADWARRQIGNGGIDGNRDVALGLVVLAYAIVSAGWDIRQGLEAKSEGGPKK